MGNTVRTDYASVSVGSPVRVGSTSEWRAPITVTSAGPPSGTNTDGIVRVTIRGGALSMSDGRNPSQSATADYAFRITA